MPKRRVLLVDDEVAVLLTMKAVLEISGFEVETATSAQEGRSKIRTREYQMVITDMRMESDAAGREVIQAARMAPYHPAVALLTAFPVEQDDWMEMGADRMLVKPMQTPVLIRQLEKLLESHAAKLAKISSAAAPASDGKAAAKKAAGKKSAAKKSAAKKTAAKKAPAKKTNVKKVASRKAAGPKGRR
ncbi:MAG TPA: response regulator [Acidobacteriaceae bacterium]|nr:response regulator [Acidobacteriaceae bacterium]